MLHFLLLVELQLQLKLEMVMELELQLQLEMELDLECPSQQLLSDYLKLLSELEVTARLGGLAILTSLATKAYCDISVLLIEVPQ